MHLRSVELHMPDRAGAVAFLASPWGLAEVASRGDTTYLRGTGAQHYLVSVKEAPERRFASATLAGSREEVEALWLRVQQAGAAHGPWVDEYDEPGRGAGFEVRGAGGEPYRFVAERDPAPAALPVDSHRPIRLAHVVFNTSDVEAASQFLVDTFGFRISDRTRRMNFIRCDDLHHVIALAASASKRTLNHVAFEMRDTDAVMRGMGRLRDAGLATAWGPGRHGPGNNVFAYFVSPFGACIEYTAEIDRVDDSYPTGTPESWKWPQGRIDQWGIFTRDDERLAASGEAFPY
ncbi:Manganese-dependent 2,3-dihydroxybiphenyl 1,2-dioxygenase [Pigmentiphaga humi]|uniref:Manganese-dependent 2,3-dihydroxybiphenyl 1,2-dioxygenase n=1 Tax=Pigmentiphaga humi TaxID=2478468 RepID=A0A3P4B4Q1_9BURK|nr:VOC family protein [Pigmentiphaga humi]VCU70506.1 Manganese-dependent 2,3-dihydroxybiphenyl 1,2-dioxygenase [Pigmentiphaga humi]